MSESSRCPNCGNEALPLGATSNLLGICPSCLAKDICSVEASAGAPVQFSVLEPRTPEEALGGDRFGRYLKVTELGRGGMGEVWKAWDTLLGRWVALKFLRGEKEDLPRFIREGRTAASLSHPHIAAVYETGETDGQHYIAMQYLDGMTLDRFPHQDRRLLIQVVRDVTRAVAHAHEQGVIHRDLKPGNIMVVNPADSGSHAYVLDFGLARRLDGGDTLSQSGIVLGTPAYLSPEQARGETATARSDVYGLGGTLYQVLTRAVPFKGLTLYEVLKHVQDDDPPLLRRSDPSIPRDLEAIVLKCLEKDPDRRYPTAASLAEDLDRWLRGEPVQARGPSLVYRLKRQAEKSRMVLSVAIAGILASLLVAMMASVRITPVVAPTAPSISANERYAAGALRTVAQVEEEFRSKDRDGNGVHDYWTGDVCGLRVLRGKDDAALDLILSALADADVAPLGTVAAAGRYRRPEKTLSQSPESGYYFRVMVSDSSGGVIEPYQQDTGGDPDMGAVHHRSRFGFCAFPAEYGQTGIKTFIINERNAVYWMDSRGSPVTVWPSATELGSVWTRVD